MPSRKKTGKNAPIFSHEFIITNHGDIVSCCCMVFMVGLMFQVTSKVAAVFIAPQHNITRTINGSDEQTVTYTNGPKDFCTIFFYSMAWIVVHAILQEYIWDKVTRKLHLSKTKNTKFNDSGALFPFYFGFFAWGTDIIIKEQYLPNIAKIWEGYPHNEMPFILKFYFILQLSFWVHCFPELYFTRAKKEEMFPKIQLYVEYLLFIWAAYLLNFTHVALCCLVIHYLVESVYHLMRMIHIAGQEEFAANLFYVWSLLFVIARFAIIALTVTTFWYGLPRLENAGFNVDIGNYNTMLIRAISMSGVLLMQAWLAWNFIRFQIKRWRENAPPVTSPRKREVRKKGKKENEKKKKEDIGEESEDVETEEKVNGEPKSSSAKLKKLQ